MQAAEAAALMQSGQLVLAAVVEAVPVQTYQAAPGRPEQQVLAAVVVVVVAAALVDLAVLGS
jgi:hypothetical protein